MSNIENIKKSIKKLFIGEYSGDFLKKKLGPLSILVFAGFMGISWILFPNYNWTQMDISNLGHPELNPLGWIFWSIGLTLTGIIMLSITGYIKRRLIPIFNIHAKIGTFFYYLSAIGMIFLGLIPQFEGDIFKILHYMFAGFAFGGLYLGTWTFCIHMLKDEEFKRKARVMTVLAFGPSMGLALTQSIRLLVSFPNNQIPWIIEFSLWEWLLLFGIFGAFVFLLFNLPKNEKE